MSDSKGLQRICKLCYNLFMDKLIKSLESDKNGRSI